MTARCRSLGSLFAGLVASAAIAGCAKANAPAPRLTDAVVDRSTQACVVSYDGFFWYRVPSGSFPPIELRYARCGLEHLSQDATPPLPRWSIPGGKTQTRFVATSLQQHVSLAGMQSLERLAAARHIPMTWMIGNMAYLAFARTYDAYHTNNGDDVQSAFFPSLHVLIAKSLPWYTPKVSVASAGTERLIPQGLYPGEHAFWGIAWNSRGTDGTWDIGAPWGAYCADVKSYKRPQPDGGCDLLAFEWTARDLTRAYLSGREDAFSTDPDDLLARGGFSVSSAVGYVRSIVDAYAAAGETQPIVMIAQQETPEEMHPGSAGIMDAIFARAVRDGMKAETLGQAASDARNWAAAPRAVAFPFIPGGKGSVYPATVDYHDTKVGMSFIGGHTLPSRIFRYAGYPVSRFNRPMPQVRAEQMPVLTGASASGGWLTLSLSAPVAIRAGAAIWTDPDRLSVRGAGAMRAGRAATILVFDLKRGRNVVRYRCPGCNGIRFDYST
ncbi:MAG TPA: hypothetical protein VFE36_09050 [Candidatus Baltobacteraceae bacterium]|nr:hypothetical protein [Candidatus Baltobacteraceae bacterium]